MRRIFHSLVAAGAVLAFTGCGGGGGGGSMSGGGGTTSIDADATKSPAPDANYYKIPSNPLGASVSNGTVTFNYWNPSASSVTVNLYTNWNDSLSSPASTISLAKGSSGLWSSGAVTLPAQGYYAISAGGSLALDPYAKSMAQWVYNGITGDSLGKAAILDPSATGPDGGWTPVNGASYYFDGSKMKDASGSPAPYAYSGNRDAIIYEAGIRDLTVDPALTGFASGHVWGTYKGLVDMLPHIQKLGVTHIQLLCPLANYRYDQTRIGTREMNTGQVTGANYNWGYDPQNYFTPSGMYSANPLSPSARINELKTLVNEIHKAGMGVILDVVYNHTAGDAILSSAGPAEYWYRASSSNGAGSHDVMSEHKMVRKVIVDSVNYWVNEYKVDGFRFDLMGVLDTVTVKDAYLAAKAANPNTIFLGEGWNGFYSGAATDYNGDGVTGADQTHASAFANMNIAMFSDSYRDIFKKGGLSEGSAFLSGTAQGITGLMANVSGRPTNFTAPGSSNVVSYLTCHDNLCLYDALVYGTNAPKTALADAAILSRAKIGYAALLTSQGAAFIHAGDEMFRTKESTATGSTTVSTTGGRILVHNSYNASDAINMVKWSNVYSGDPIAGGFTNYDPAQNGYKLYAYVKGLVALRKSTNAFRLPDANIPANIVSLPPTGAGSTTLAFGYKVASTDGTGTYYVFHNADSTAKTFPVPASLTGAVLLADGDSAGTTPLGASSTVALSGDGLTVTVQPLTSAIYKN
ncbi:MAG TPA: alpha-amylase family glycosyl hydrolase [Holophaga sp.]|nr:alpha-amylase family glycosyl hydrolase [Holophaga sp.]